MASHLFHHAFQPRWERWLNSKPRVNHSFHESLLVVSQLWEKPPNALAKTHLTFFFGVWLTKEHIFNSLLINEHIWWPTQYYQNPSPNRQAHQTERTKYPLYPQRTGFSWKGFKSHSDTRNTCSHNPLERGFQLHENWNQWKGSGQCRHPSLVLPKLIPHPQIHFMLLPSHFFSSNIEMLTCGPINQSSWCCTGVDNELKMVHPRNILAKERAIKGPFHDHPQRFPNFTFLPMIWQL